MRKRGREKRGEERVSASLPLNVGGVSAIARDVSASGMFFETDAVLSVGRPIDVALDLDTPWGKVIFKCTGKVIRLEPHDRKVGVAVRFIDRLNHPVRKPRSAKPRPRSKSAKARS
jgi:hypothetical protein